MSIKYQPTAKNSDLMMALGERKPATLFEVITMHPKEEMFK